MERESRFPLPKKLAAFAGLSAFLVGCGPSNQPEVKPTVVPPATSTSRLEFTGGIRLLPDPADAEVLLVSACTEGVPVGVTMKASIRREQGGQIDVLKELGVPCFNSNTSYISDNPDNPQLRPLRYKLGKYLITVVAHTGDASWNTSDPTKVVTETAHIKINQQGSKRIVSITNESN